MLKIRFPDPPVVASFLGKLPLPEVLARVSVCGLSGIAPDASVVARNGEPGLGPLEDVLQLSRLVPVELFGVGAGEGKRKWHCLLNVCEIECHQAELITEPAREEPGAVAWM